ncbi:MAG: TrfB-related DNA-binding protein [Chthoniobacterales bacterium]
MKNKIKINSLPENQSNKRGLVSAWIEFLPKRETKPMPPELKQALHRHLIELQHALSGMRNCSDTHEESERSREVRHIALELLDRRLLRNNHHLTAAATESQIHNQLDRSCKAALGYAKKELRRREDAETQRLRRVQDQTRERVVFGRHVYNQESNLKDCICALEIAITEGHVSESSAEIFLQIVRDGWRQTEIAHQKGVSRSAISQRVKNVLEALIRITRRSTL